MLENAKIRRIKCEILGNFQTLCPWLEGQKKWEIHQIHFILYVFCQIPYNTVGGGQIFLRPSKRGHINFWPSSQIGTVSFFLPVCESSSSHTSQFPVSENHRKSLIQHYERISFYWFLCINCSFIISAISERLQKAWCLKITEKVSFNNASEASYGYIFQWTKSHKKCQKLKACGQTVLLERSFWIIKKCQNSNTTFLSNFQLMCKSGRRTASKFHMKISLDSQIGRLYCSSLEAMMKNVDSSSKP